MSSARLRRLTADFEKLREYVKQHPRLRMLQAQGDPPEQYQLEYCIQSLRRVHDEMKVIKSHVIEILLPRNYPRTPPQCRMLTPIFHPNIAPHAICVGDHWSAGEPLQSIVARIGEMLAYQSYNTKSPLNGEAARWVDQYKDRLPLDPVSMLPKEPCEVKQTPHPEPSPDRPIACHPAQAVSTDRQQAAGRSQANPRPVQSESIRIACPKCEAIYRISTQQTARRARCQRCQTIIEVPPSEGNA